MHFLPGGILPVVPTTKERWGGLHAEAEVAVADVTPLHSSDTKVRPYLKMINKCFLFISSLYHGLDTIITFKLLVYRQVIYCVWYISGCNKYCNIDTAAGLGVVTNDLQTIALVSLYTDIYLFIHVLIVKILWLLTTYAC